MDRRRPIGGIFRLLEIRDNHPGEFAYDFRSRFNLSAWEIGKTVSYLEAIYLVSILVKEPSSRLQAALNKWKYPVSQEWIAITHLFDLFAMANSKKKPKPHPTPWPDPNKTRIGSARSNSYVLAALKHMNPEGD